MGDGIGAIAGTEWVDPCVVEAGPFVPIPLTAGAIEAVLAGDGAKGELTTGW